MLSDGRSGILGSFPSQRGCKLHVWTFCRKPDFFIFLKPYRTSRKLPCLPAGSYSVGKGMRRGLLFSGWCLPPYESAPQIGLDQFKLSSEYKGHCTQAKKRKEDSGTLPELEKQKEPPLPLAWFELWCGLSEANAFHCFIHYARDLFKRNVFFPFGMSQEEGAKNFAIQCSAFTFQPIVAEACLCDLNTESLQQDRGSAKKDIKYYNSLRQAK